VIVSPFTTGAQQGAPAVILRGSSKKSWEIAALTKHLGAQRSQPDYEIIFNLIRALGRGEK
jgi:hypothetical protein